MRVSFFIISCCFLSFSLHASEKILPENPLIKEMITKVSPDSCARLLRDLCDMFNRNDYNLQWNKGTLVPYLQKKFKEYGCDTVYLVPTPGFDAPSVIGIKKGKKNPSVKEFCLIGAHVDNVRTDDTKGLKRHQGAYDNGCGDVGFLEVARVLKNYEFENSIMYAGFNVEENGLAGSKALVNQFKANGSKILGGAITFDMLGLKPGTSTAVSYSVYDGITGAKQFVSHSDSLCKMYNVKLNISTTTSSSIPTDVQNFWNGGFVGAFGRGGSGAGSYHTVADSIDKTFDSVWLANAVTPGVVIIADYAVPINGVISKYNPSVYTIPITTQFSPSGSVTISIADSRITQHPVISIYSVEGRLINTIVLAKQSDGQYSGIWNCRTVNGHPVAKGLYVISCIVGADNFRTKIVVGR